MHVGVFLLLFPFHSGSRLQDGSAHTQEGSSAFNYSCPLLPSSLLTASSSSSSPFSSSLASSWDTVSLFSSSWPWTIDLLVYLFKFWNLIMHHSLLLTFLMLSFAWQSPVSAIHVLGFGLAVSSFSLMIYPRLAVCHIKIGKNFIALVF